MSFYAEGLDCLERDIVSELEKLRVYDCHEHLPPEESYIKGSRDAFTLFSHYCQHDLYTAGMDKETMGRILWEKGDIDWKWQTFKPYYDKIIDTCYTRSAHITLEKFYGEERLTDENYRRVSRAVADASVPGLYRHVLADVCGIEKCINCDYFGQSTEGGLLAQTIWIAEVCSAADIRRSFNAVPDNLEELASWADARLALAAVGGAPGMKLFAFDTEPVADADAAAVLSALQKDSALVLPAANALNRWLKLRQMCSAGEHGLVCCVHTGYWNDYRELNPAGLLPFVRAHHFHRIDLYHAGYPYMREAIMLGKVWPGVRMNMAWTYLISRRFAYDALEEMTEMLPDNKIFGFGGDYYVVEKVFGHLCMARETIARVLAAKIRRREITLERAGVLAQKMLYENPKEFYGF